MSTVTFYGANILPLLREIYVDSDIGVLQGKESAVCKLWNVLFLRFTITLF